jgi:hypothetical protein
MLKVTPEQLMIFYMNIFLSWMERHLPGQMKAVSLNQNQ